MAINLRTQKVRLYPTTEYDEDPYLLQITGARGGLRAYQKPGTNYPLWSVTSILDKTVDKPGLMNWANKVGREAVKDKLASHIGDELTAEIIDDAVFAAKTAPYREKTKAGNIGTRAHDLLAEYITANIESDATDVIVPVELATVWESFKDWESDNDIDRYLKAEFAVYSESFRYAGSVDALAYNEKDNKYILDQRNAGSSLRQRIICSSLSATGIPPHWGHRVGHMGTYRTMGYTSGQRECRVRSQAGNRPTAGTGWIPECHGYVVHTGSTRIDRQCENRIGRIF